MVITAEPTRLSRRDVRDHPWFPLASVAVIVVVLGLVLVRVVHRDVVTGWQVLATCPAQQGAVPTALSSSLDTSGCATAPTQPRAGRGWPVVAVALPAAAGSAPEVTRVRSDRATSTVTIDYRSSGSPAPGDVLVFVEVPPTAVPVEPLTVRASSDG